MLKNIHDRHLARALNRYLGTVDPMRPCAENKFAGGYGCRWCDSTNRWVVVLPGEATEKIDHIENHFRLHGLETFRLPTGNGAGVELSGYVQEEGLRFQ